MSTGYIRGSAHKKEKKNIVFGQHEVRQKLRYNIKGQKVMLL